MPTWDEHLWVTVYRGMIQGTQRGGMRVLLSSVFTRQQKIQKGILHRIGCREFETIAVFRQLQPELFQVILRLIALAASNYGCIDSANRSPGDDVYISQLAFRQCLEDAAAKSTK